MKHMNLHKVLSAGILVGASAVAASAIASPPQGRFGPDYGMGPGMMGGYGMGPAMTGGQGFAYVMGPDMWAVYASRADLNLTAEQRSRVAKIHNDVWRKHWDLIDKMQDEQAQMNEQYYSDQRDDAALGKSYRDMVELRQQMSELSLGARRQIDAVLTLEQRDKLKHR